MNGLFSTAASLLDRRQLTAVWLPVLALVGAFTGVFVAAHGRAASIAWWNALGGEGQVAVVSAIVIATVLAGQLLSARRISLVRLYEGYWPASWLRRQLLARQLRRHSGRGPDSPELYLTYPRRTTDVMPTRLGNLLRAAELHARRYGIADPVTAWTRLYVVLPAQFTTAFAAAATSLETAVTISFLGVVFAVAGGLLGAAVLPWQGAVLCVSGGLIVAVGGYRAATRAARPYAQLVRTAFDVHRFLLLDAMRLELPPSFEAERAQWTQLGKVWYLGWPDPQQASRLRYPGSGTTADAQAVRESGRSPASATRPLAAFHVLTAPDIHSGDSQPGGVQALVGRYTLTAVPKGSPLRAGDLGPVLPGGLTGRVLVTVPVVSARTAARGMTVTLLVVPRQPEAPATAPSRWFPDVLVLDRPGGDDIVAALPSGGVQDLLDAATGGVIHLIIPSS